ncbi:MAG TPA: hypothetical protein VLQ45_21960 [Thermoanaerobaculia bacterium]|nr:hypothetical protein [Thermoanaerobaculia bacterium]
MDVTQIATDTFEERRIFCAERLGELRRRVAEIPELNSSSSGLCIYATGSYGRQEASGYSDLDLFFVHNDQPVSNINKTLIDAALIKATREMGFVDFSGDGEYLQVHNVKEILDNLGNREDDYRNFFTARMLLLLESTPIYNDSVYMESIERVVDAYYRDYHDHEKDFRPVFLVNDIIRFWKTLCLNYEHSRNRKDVAKKSASHLKNLKLKFSRMLTCFSTLLLLARHNEQLAPDRLVELVGIPPLDRLRESAYGLPGGESSLSRLLDEYAWFLQVTNRPKDELLQWIADQSVRDEAFDHARMFGREMYDLLFKIDREGDLIRYLVV